ncbi:MAG: sigma-54 dependent transcriptional regulator [Desulfovibrionaceae bacterium]|nr:sigma-54 dependent transcriptional regulator [Desulfovibrionaceae bacterium]
MGENILVIEDDAAFREMLVEALTAKGFETQCAGSVEEGLQRLGEAPFDLVLTDVMLPGKSGIEAISLIRDMAPATDVIVMTGYSTREKALEAVRRGAYDFFSKPFSLTELEIVIRRAVERRGLRAELASLRTRLRTARGAPAIVGQSEGMRRVVELIHRVAGLDTTVLVTGESGTGKEVVSDAVHALSKRATGPFVKVNCAAIPENLLESELFGHEKGAFTGALALKKGKFELAQGGSLMLDELGDMPLFLQPKLLRAVEQKQIERVGGARPIDIDIRIIAATNQELPQLVAEKKFRADLYYRLSVAVIRIPPLRERKEDLPLLVEHFLSRINVKLGLDLRGVTREAMGLLYAHDWPGNVRQLANVLERAAIMSTGEVLEAEHFRDAFQARPRAAGQGDCLPGAAEAGGGHVASLRQTLEDVERSMIESALAKKDGVQKDAAALLGISPKNLWNKLQKHGIDPARFSGQVA